MNFRSGRPRAIYTPDNGIPDKPMMTCPYCGSKTTLTPIRWTLHKWIGSCDAGGCHKQLYADVEYTGATGRTMHFNVIETFPKYSPPKEPSIPDNIWDDYAEAYSSFNSQNYKSTVVMSRRVIQNASLDKGASKKDDKGNWIFLKNQIKSGFPGAEFKYLRELADEIKYFGDYGAHPNDDGIDQVSEDDAKEILDFTSSFLEYAYIQPAKVKELISRRRTKKP